jgi:hypothetical protein
MNQGPRWDYLMKKTEVENLVTLSLNYLGLSQLLHSGLAGMDWVLKLGFDTQGVN